MNQQEHDGRDPRYAGKTPRYSDEQRQPEPERPMSGSPPGAEPDPEDKPSQAEGER